MKSSKFNESQIIAILKQQESGLSVNDICRAQDDEVLANIMRDFKKFTSKRSIETTINNKETCREWLLEITCPSKYPSVGDYSEEELRLVRIKFMNEYAN